MLPYGYNPENYGGKIWWNDKDPGMRAIWGTQEDYDNFIRNGGTWEQYEQIAQNRMKSRKSESSDTSLIETQEKSFIKTR